MIIKDKTKKKRQFLSKNEEDKNITRTRKKKWVSDLLPKQHLLGNYSLFHKKLIHSGLSKNFKKKTKNLSNPSTVKRCACSCCLKVNKHWRHLPIASHTTKQSLLFFVYFIFFCDTSLSSKGLLAWCWASVNERNKIKEKTINHTTK